MKAQITPTAWQEVREQVAKVNPALACSIDEFSPSKDYVIYKISYPFGTDIVGEGRLLIPNQYGELNSIDHDSIDPSFKKTLSYSPIPFGLCLNKSAEIYVDMDQRNIPLHVFMPGDTFGLWEVLDPQNALFGRRKWNVAAGAKSIFMLPKISDAICLNRLSKASGIHSLAPPKTIFEQASLFAEVVHSKQITTNWACEILVFGDKWFLQHDNHLSWLKLQHYLLKTEWMNTFHWRNKLTFELIGQAFANAQAHKNLKPSTYLIDTVLHLVSLAVGSSTGFAPIIGEDEVSAPCLAIQTAFVDYYGLKMYIPTLMQPRQITNQSPIYYSLLAPTVLASSPNTRITHSVIEDLRMAKRLLDALKSQLQSEHTAIYGILKDVEFSFFHSESDEYFDICSTDAIPKEDAGFLDNPFTKGRSFCDTASFLRGCVRIRKV